MTTHTTPLFLRVLLLLGLCTAGFTAVAHAQKNNEKSSAPKVADYRLKSTYQSGIAQYYEFTETTHAQRIAADSNSNTYDRTVKYFITMRCLEASKDLSQMMVTIDSMYYDFKSDGVVIKFNSAKDLPQDFADLTYYSAPIGRDVELTYTPYGEVTIIKGEQLDFWRNYIEENASTMDSLALHLWRIGLDNVNMLHIGDVQKRIVPGTRKAIDSSWVNTMSVRNDGVTYSGKVRSKLKEYTGGYFHIVTKDTLPVVSNQKAYNFGIPDLVEVLDGNIIIDQQLDLTTAGTVDQISQKAVATLRTRYNGSVYNRSVETTTLWKLKAEYQW